VADDIAQLRISRTPLSSNNPRKKWLKWGLIGLAVLLLLGYLATRPKVAEVKTLTVLTTFPTQQLSVLNATGYVVAQRKAAVSSKGSGRLDWLGVAEGSVVKAGQLIAKLDARDVLASRDAATANSKLTQANAEQSKAQIEQARANVALAQAEAKNAASSLARDQDLLKQGFVSSAVIDASQTRLDRALASVAAAQAAVNAAQAGLLAVAQSGAVAAANARVAAVNLDYTEIRAPFDGVVLTKNANVGDIITPFSSAAGSQGAVVTMADMSTLEVEADVSESSLAKITVGMATEILLDALPDKRFRGTVSRIVPTVDRAKATVMTKVTFEQLDPRILPEMSAKVSFLSKPASEADQKAFTTVSPDALLSRDGKQLAFIVQDDKVKQVEVLTNGKLGELHIVTSGLKTGDKVVSKPDATLQDGAAVKVATK
jgi:HlyD family secretion protein